MAAESEQRLREEIERLETSRSRLSSEVETMSKHLESERNRLRTALGDILRWVDQNVQPITTVETAPIEPAAPEPVEASADPSPAPAPAPAPTPAQATIIQGGNRPAGGSPQGAPAPKGSETGPTGEVTRMHPTGTSASPANTNAPLPL